MHSGVQRQVYLNFFPLCVQRLTMANIYYRLC